MSPPPCASHNHAALFVARPGRSARLYTEVLAMEVITREPRANAVSLRLPRSGNHHDPGLFGAGTAGGPKRRGVIGLYRLARQPGTIGEPPAARQALPGAPAAKRPWAIRHAASASKAQASGAGARESAHDHEKPARESPRCPHSGKNYDIVFMWRPRHVPSRIRAGRPPGVPLAPAGGPCVRCQPPSSRRPS
jgi:catechol 2,3-dioxygenase-like lactoylglutathione lyase family enzyme